MLGPGGAPGPALLRRAAHAARLWHSGAARVVVATGGPAGAHPTEARAMRVALEAAGVPAAAVIEEDRARNTLENALFTIEILRARNLSPAIVVTDGYHLPRALMLFRLLGQRARGEAAPLIGPGDPGGRRAAFRREAIAAPRDFARGLLARMRRGQG